MVNEPFSTVFFLLVFFSFFFIYTTIYVLICKLNKLSYCIPAAQYLQKYGTLSTNVSNVASAWNINFKTHVTLAKQMEFIKNLIYIENT